MRTKKKTRVSKSDRKKAIRARVNKGLVHHGKAVSHLLLVHFRAILTVVGANALILLEVVVQEAGIIVVLAHTQSRGGDAVQGVHVIRDRARVLGSRGRDRAGGTGVLNPGRGEGHLSGSGLAQIDVGRQLGNFALGFEETRLQIDDVLAKLVVLANKGLDLVLEGVNVLDLFLELADVGLLALAEGTL